VTKKGRKTKSAKRMRDAFQTIEMSRRTSFSSQSEGRVDPNREKKGATTSLYQNSSSPEGPPFEPAADRERLMKKPKEKRKGE